MTIYYSIELLPSPPYSKLATKPYSKLATKPFSSAAAQQNPTLFLTTTRRKTTQISGVLTRISDPRQTKPAAPDVVHESTAAAAKPTTTQSQSLDLNRSHLKKMAMTSFNTGKHADALHYLKLLVEQGHKPLLILATKLMQAFFNRGDIDRAVQVINILETYGRPDVFAYNTMISGLSKANRMDLANQVLDKMTARGYSADVVTYNIMIGSHCSKGDLRSAMEVFEKLKRSENGRPCPTVVTYTILIEATIYNGGGVMEAVKLLEDMRRRELKPDMYLMNAIIRGMCKEGMEDLAFQYILTMPSTGCQPDVISYNTVLRTVLLDKGEWDKSKMIVNMMNSRGCYANVVTYSILITALCREGRVEQGMDLLRLMLEQGLRPDTYCYEPLISRFCKDGRVDLAIGVLDIMITEGCAPDMVNYNTILSALCKNGEADAALEIFDKLVMGGCGVGVPDVGSYNMLISTLWQSGDGAKMVEFGRKMIQNDGVKPDRVTYNSVLSWLCRDGLVDKAVQLLEYMRGSSGVSLKPSVVTYNMVLLGLCKVKRVNDAIELLVKMIEEDKYLPNETTYVLLVEGIGFTGWQNDALELADSLLQKGVITHDSFLRLCKTFHVQTEVLATIVD